MLNRPVTNEERVRFALSRILIKESGCHEFQGSIGGMGYGNMAVVLKDGKKGTRAMHRVSWEHYAGKIPEGLNVLHKCDNRKCINPDHLFIGTQKENMRDAIKKRRFVFIEKPIGEKNVNAKLKEKDILLIKRSRETTRALARMFNVTFQAIWYIKKGQNWSHVIDAAIAQATKGPSTIDGVEFYQV